MPNYDRSDGGAGGDHIIDSDLRWERGTAIYASQFGVPQDQLSEFMAEHFGERMAREAILAGAGAWADDELSLRDRSLVVLASLVTQGVVGDRLSTHAQWAMEHGLTAEQIEAAVTLLGVYAGYPRASEAMETVRAAIENTSNKTQDDR